MIKKLLMGTMAVAIVVMGYLCYKSIEKPIEFKNEQQKRQAKVINALINIRTAEEEFKDQNDHYTASFDSLIAFVKSAKKTIIKKSGTINDYQLSKGLTEKIALHLTREDALGKYAMKPEEYEAFKATFRRDTVRESLLVAVFGANFPIDSLAYVPVKEAKGQKFTLETGEFTNASGMKIPLFDASVTNKVYLSGLDKQEIINMDDVADKMEKFAGLKVGDIDAPNNNAGNWE